MVSTPFAGSLMASTRELRTSPISVMALSIVAWPSSVLPSPSTAETVATKAAPAVSAVRVKSPSAEPTAAVTMVFTPFAGSLTASTRALRTWVRVGSDTVSVPTVMDTVTPLSVSSSVLSMVTLNTSPSAKVSPDRVTASTWDTWTDTVLPPMATLYTSPTSTVPSAGSPDRVTVSTWDLEVTVVVNDAPRVLPSRVRTPSASPALAKTVALTAVSALMASTRELRTSPRSVMALSIVAWPSSVLPSPSTAETVATKAAPAVSAVRVKSPSAEPTAAVTMVFTPFAGSLTASTRALRTWVRVGSDTVSVPTVMDTVTPLSVSSSVLSMVTLNTSPSAKVSPDRVTASTWDTWTDTVLPPMATLYTSPTSTVPSAGSPDRVTVSTWDTWTDTVTPLSVPSSVLSMVTLYSSPASTVPDRVTVSTWAMLKIVVRLTVKVSPASGAPVSVRVSTWAVPSALSVVVARVMVLASAPALVSATVAVKATPGTLEVNWISPSATPALAVTRPSSTIFALATLAWVEPSMTASAAADASPAAVMAVKASRASVSAA